MLVIHLGGNSVVENKQGTIVRKIEQDIQYLSSLFVDTIIVWSDILFRFEWQGIDRAQFKGMEKKRKRMNRAGRLAVCKTSNGRIISHDINKTTPGFYTAKGVHLSLVGNAFFLKTFENAIESFNTSDLIRYNCPC